jgi:hypothetical protein
MSQPVLLIKGGRSSLRSDAGSRKFASKHHAIFLERGISMDRCINKIDGWEEKPILNDLHDVLIVLNKLQEKGWVSRGINFPYGRILSKFDREFDSSLKREDLINIENDFVRNDTCIYLDEKENERSVYELYLKILWLGKFQHYEGPTRLVDWSLDPFVSAFFACYKNTGNMGELWCFDKDKYNNCYGPRQWDRIPEIRNTSNSYERILSVVFNKELPTERFIVCINNSRNFPRIKKQQGLFSLSPFFGTNHADAIAALFDGDTRFYSHYLISSDLINNLNEYLCMEKHICKTKVFPDDDIPFNQYVIDKSSEIKKKYSTYLLPERKTFLIPK